MNIQDKKNLISNVIFVIFIIGIVSIACILFEKYNYNNYQKSEYYAHKTSFLRDSKIKYNKSKSYKISSKDYNDAIFYKTIKTEKNTPYKITCKVKTENIETEKENSNAGANIAVLDTTEKSKSITGTNDWQEIEMFIDSKEREEINIGFRLGSYEDNCKGTAWFSDITIEKGNADTSNNWKFGIFLVDNIDVNIEKNGEKQNIKISLTDEDKKLMIQDADIFKNSIKSLSGNQMTADVNIYEIKDSINTLSYDEENGYYISSKDIEPYIDEAVKNNNFDHIFLVVRFGDIIKNTEIPVNDWIGLGYMDYYGIGFSNIRLPNSQKNYLYTYSNTNTFPEEVFVHEFLHSLERNLNERNYNIPELHSYSKYGYKSTSLEGLKSWYKDYMQGKIKTEDGETGLDSNVYKIKPVKQSCFEYSIKQNYFDEPKNILEELYKTVSKVI